MREILIWFLLIAALAGAADQVLLKMESRGWIHYRWHGISRGAAAYHMRELQSIYDPGIQHVIEIQTKEQAQRDDTGDPLA
jgi:hypothetical protein